METLLTIGEIARRLGQELHRIEYVIRSRNIVDDLPEDFTAARATVLLDIWRKQQPKPLIEKPRGGEEDGGHVH